MHLRAYSYNYSDTLPEVGHNKHCPAEAYETADKSKQQWPNDMLLWLTGSSQFIVLKQTGAVRCKIKKI